MSKLLTFKQIEDALDGLSGWSFADDKITKTYHFKSFREAISFVLRLAFEAEELDHHPELYNVYNRVKISLCSHDSGGKVTAKDIKLAEKIEHFAWTD